jgi:hypothetical protein
MVALSCPHAPGVEIKSAATRMIVTVHGTAIDQRVHRSPAGADGEKAACFIVCLLKLRFLVFAIDIHFVSGGCPRVGAVSQAFGGAEML